MNRWGALSICSLIAAAMCLIAVLKMPSAYYSILRIFVCASAGLTVATMIDANKTGRAMPAILVAILYNPFVPIRLSRDAWAPINFATATTLAAYAFVNRREPEARKPSAELGKQSGGSPTKGVSVASAALAGEHLVGGESAPQDGDAEVPLHPEVAQFVRELEDRLCRRVKQEPDEDDPVKSQARVLQAKIDAIPHPLEGRKP